MIYRQLFVILFLFNACWALALAPADPARFEKAIQAFEAEDQAKAPPKDVTLFTGASNIRRWQSLPERFKKTPVLNRGFGGSHISDVVHFADRIVLKYKPKQIYLNAGSNDLHSGRTPEEVLAAFEAFVSKVQKALPKTKLAFLSIPTSPSRWDEVELVKTTNSLISASCAKNSVDFIDIFPLLLGSDGKPRPELYVEDKLHFSEAGYDVVTSAIKWQKEIFTFAKLDAAKAPPANPIVFTGSSSIRMWKSLADDFPGLPVMNRGFGGSEVFDSFNYAHLTVLQYLPKHIVMYAGGNDINAGKTPQRVLSDFKAFVSRVHAALPECRISYISNAPNPKRWALIEQMRECSRLIEEFTKTDKRLQFINVYPHMLGPDRKPKPDIFLKDELHMNAKGYAIWKEVVGPFLTK
ncbi:GDSL-type esterase/lipase family protein [Prosthecobacter sp.]|uniref:GDSL-type esterase/lipase family protein n=1 Tax=Prosthecobacter sp. TaxID=1965333 RepID=UPI002ABCC233|nr:GDSL-type esterase/lipase family protein [Prosthecobacter sp.]MDZ4404173.1 GDSL-type esterase/lipase family protein [Prosthecobacter sp.]